MGDKPRATFRCIVFRLRLPFGLAIDISRQLTLPKDIAPDERIVDSWELAATKIAKGLNREGD